MGRSRKSSFMKRRSKRKSQKKSVQKRSEDEDYDDDDDIDSDEIREESDQNHKDRLIQQAIERKEHLKIQKLERQREFNGRLCTLQMFYKRLSFSHKYEYVLSLLKQIKSLEAINGIYNLINILYDKILSYVTAVPNPNIANKELLSDHDRMLDEKTIQKCKKSNLIWFQNLGPADQIRIVQKLLLRTGGNIINKLYFPVQEIYHKLLKQKSQKVKCVSLDVVDVKDSYEVDFVEDDTDVIRERKKWDDLLNNYREEIGIPTTGQKVDLAQNESDNKNEIVSNQKPTGKHKKAKRKSINKDGDSKFEMDWIQLLPIWIVKQIFSYFDQKTLQSIKNVNQYWAYVVDEIKKDIKVRKDFKSNLKKVRDNIGENLLENCATYFTSEEYKPLRKSRREHRILQLMQRGANINLLRKLFSRRNLEESSVLTNFADVSLLDTPMPFEQMTTFPRSIDDELVLYKREMKIIEDFSKIINIPALERNKSIFDSDIGSIDLFSF